ncbi:MAG: hydrolase [Pyrinomonadaceae bacterium]|nr:hydrolase [Pyrinomonadaceae bacterium]
MAHPNILNRENTVFVIIDIQEAFRSPIPDFEEIAVNTSIMARGCQLLNVPIIVTEQYPKGLGRTAEEILLSLTDNAEIIEKTAFSACGATSFGEKLKSFNAKQIILAGIEAHICVNQTAHDLLDQGFQVHLLQDCVSSRKTHDKHTGIEKMKLSGVIPSNVEMALFELMKDSKHEQFKEIQKLVK